MELWTSAPCHLTLRWTATEPVKTSIPKAKRGALWYYDNKMCFVAWQDIEQLEPGDTTLHTFLWPGWTICNTRWFIFTGTIGGIVSPSNTAIFSAHYEGAKDMITLGKFGEAEVLLGHVKLKEGVNITITRIDGDNALEIAATGGAPAYTGPNLGPKWDFLLAGLPSESYGHLATTNVPSYVNFLPQVGDKALFMPRSNIDTTTYLVSLLGMNAQVLTARAGNTGFSMPSPVIQSRFIFLPQGYSAAGVRGSALYRYDLFTNTWATMAAITTLGAGFRFDSTMGFVWDGDDLLYAMGAWDGAAARAAFAYSIAGNSWVELADHPLGAYYPTGAVHLVGDAIFTHRTGGGKKFYRYNIAADTWTALADTVLAYTSAGLTQDLDIPDRLLLLGESGGVDRAEEYSIAGDAWGALANTNARGGPVSKPHYYSLPVPHLLTHVVTLGELWLYKL